MLTRELEESTGEGTTPEPLPKSGPLPPPHPRPAAYSLTWPGTVRAVDTPLPPPLGSCPPARGVPGLTRTPAPGPPCRVEEQSPRWGTAPPLRPRLSGRKLPESVKSANNVLTPETDPGLAYV